MSISYAFKIKLQLSVIPANMLIRKKVNGKIILRKILKPVCLWRVKQKQGLLARPPTRKFSLHSSCVKEHRATTSEQWRVTDEFIIPAKEVVVLVYGFLTPAWFATSSPQPHKGGPRDQKDAKTKQTDLSSVNSLKTEIETTVQRASQA